MPIVGIVDTERGEQMSVRPRCDRKASGPLCHLGFDGRKSPGHQHRQSLHSACAGGQSAWVPKRSSPEFSRQWRRRWCRLASIWAACDRRGIRRRLSTASRDLANPRSGAAQEGIGCLAESLRLRCEHQTDHVVAASLAQRFARDLVLMIAPRVQLPLSSVNWRQMRFVMPVRARSYFRPCAAIHRASKSRCVMKVQGFHRQRCRSHDNHGLAAVMAAHRRDRHRYKSGGTVVVARRYPQALIIYYYFEMIHIRVIRRHLVAVGQL